MRRLRGLFGLALAGSVPWGLAGFVIGLVLQFDLVPRIHVGLARPVPGGLPAAAAVVGGVIGAVNGAVLAHSSGPASAGSSSRNFALLGLPLGEGWPPQSLWDSSSKASLSRLAAGYLVPLRPWERCAWRVTPWTERRSRASNRRQHSVRCGCWARSDEVIAAECLLRSSDRYFQCAYCAARPQLNRRVRRNACSL